MFEVTIYSFAPLISSLLFLLLGFLVFSKNKKASVNLTFLLVCLVTFWWQFSWFILFSIKDPQIGAYLVKIGYIGIIFIPITFFHFFIQLLGKNIILDKVFTYLSYLSGLVLVYLLFFTDYFISGFYKYFFGFYPKAGLAHPAYLALLLLLAIRILYLSFKDLKATRKISSYKFYQLKYVLIALLFYVLSASDFLANYGREAYPLGFIFILIFLAIFAYTIVRHRLMDIRIALRRSFVYLSSVLVIIIPATVVLYYFDLYLPEYIILASLGVLILAVSLFSPIRDYYYRVANKYFFSSLYDSREVIGKLSDGLRSTLEAREIYKLISETLMNSLHVKSFGVLNYQEKEENYLVQFNNGFELGTQKDFFGDKILHKNYIEKAKALVVEEVKSVAYERHKPLIDFLNKLGVAVIVPLNIKNETLGIMVLGAKESGDMFNDEDLKTLETISSQAAIAIKNAQLYEETKKFSITLQKEVERQTAELKRANEELQKLDKAKSDFISIASHQLRTPLTAIKGFTSMILEGSYGKVSVTLKDKMEKIYESTERLIKLVNELLDLTHIESGKIEYNLAKVDFDQMVESVAEELKGQAEKKKLALSVDLANKELWVNADESKLRQVVMNLIDNAVKYTEKGNIKVSVCQKDGFVEFCVKDTGIGLSAEGIKTLFQKFVRGETASHYHTEGSGVGLYVAKKLIEDQKGQIWVESEGENRGSSFFIKMPAYQSNVEEGQARQ